MPPEYAALAAAPPPPPPKPREWTIAGGNARICELEKLCGEPHALPIFNRVRQNRRIEQLETLLVQKNGGTLAQAAPAAAVAPAIAAAVKTANQLPTLPANTIHRCTWDAMGFPERNAFFRNGGKLVDNPAGYKPAANIPPEVAEHTVTLKAYLGLSHTGRAELAQDGGYLTNSDFRKLNDRQKSAFCSNGGHICPDQD